MSKINKYKDKDSYTTAMLNDFISKIQESTEVHENYDAMQEGLKRAQERFDLAKRIGFAQTFGLFPQNTGNGFVPEPNKKKVAQEGTQNGNDAVAYLSWYVPTEKRISSDPEGKSRTLQSYKKDNKNYYFEYPIGVDSKGKELTKKLTVPISLYNNMKKHNSQGTYLAEKKNKILPEKWTSLEAVLPSEAGNYSLSNNNYFVDTDGRYSFTNGDKATSHNRYFPFYAMSEKDFDNYRNQQIASYLINKSIQTVPDIDYSVMDVNVVPNFKGVINTEPYFFKDGKRFFYDNAEPYIRFIVDNNENYNKPISEYEKIFAQYGEYNQNNPNAYTLKNIRLLPNNKILINGDIQDLQSITPKSKTKKQEGDQVSNGKVNLFNRAINGVKNGYNKIKDDYKDIYGKQTWQSIGLNAIDNLHNLTSSNDFADRETRLQQNLSMNSIDYGPISYSNPIENNNFGYYTINNKKVNPLRMRYKSGGQHKIGDVLYLSNEEIEELEKKGYKLKFE